MVYPPQAARSAAPHHHSIVQRVLLFCGLLVVATRAAEATEIDYLAQVKPLLQKRCFACHGALKHAANLRLDTVAAMLHGGDSGPALVRGQATTSHLIDRVSATDIGNRMPPEHEGEPLTAAEIEVLRQWIDQGATGPADEQPESDPRDHWAFRPIQRPLVPVVQRSTWVRNPIDAFIAARHEQLGLIPQREATRRVLLRRLSLDLIGLPPTPAEIAAAESAPATDWYEQTVRRLLDDPRHGERWARHWMDIWRYSDWWGLGDQLRNSQKHMWHWRDWIIESLNDDVPYDRMIERMLAADELEPNDLQQLRATGYLARNYFLFNRHQWMDETIEHVSKSLLGITANCAKCHDHKYDPISQTDYYQLRAFFEPYHVRLDVVPGEHDLTRDGIPRAFDGLLDVPTYRLIRGQENQPDMSLALTPAVPKFLGITEPAIEPITLPKEAWQPDRGAWVLETYRDEARRQLAAAEANNREIVAKYPALHESSPTPAAEAPSTASSPTEPPTPTTEAALALELATRTVSAAETELRSVEARIAATLELDHDTDHLLARQAAQAEREAAVAHARRHLAQAHLRHHQSPADQRDTLAQEIDKARAALETAQKQLDTPTDQFTHFIGAQWTPTRFLNSTADDPTVTFPDRSTGRRTALARWITDPSNPLTARVAVNHLWMRHFGALLVPTVFDFGRNGQPPTHPELLDWLASELIDSQWSMKHIHRLIVESATYRLSLSTSGADSNLAIDADNRWLWRRQPSRLESQVVRDALLDLAGQLETTLGGPSVLPEHQASSKRRSIYFFHSNNARNLFLTMFDDALVTECYRRERSIVPQQALAMTNSQLVLDVAPAIAARLTEFVNHAVGHHDNDEPFVRAAFGTLLATEPSITEIAKSLAAINAWQKMPEAGSGEQARQFARAQFVWVLLNHHQFVTIE